MRLICTKCRRRNARLGTAELELLLVIPVLLLILFLAGGMMTLGTARMSNVYNAENNAYGQVVEGRGFYVSGDPVPVNDPFGPALPNRFALADERQTVVLTQQVNPHLVNLEDKAIFLDPAWHYSTWPQTGDRAAIQGWFEAYVGESHPGEIVTALGLQGAGPP